MDHLQIQCLFIVSLAPSFWRTRIKKTMAAHKRDRDLQEDFTEDSLSAEKRSKRLKHDTKQDLKSTSSSASSSASSTSAALQESNPNEGTLITTDTTTEQHTQPTKSTPEEAVAYLLPHLVRLQSMYNKSQKKVEELKKINIVLLNTCSKLISEKKKLETEVSLSNHRVALSGSKPYNGIKEKSFVVAP